MKELHDILDAWRSLRDQGKMAALATVVHVDGSAYRKPGARMLIGADGVTVGGVSGGCLEADVVERARRVLETGQGELRVYDSTRDDDLLLGMGLGCQGVVQIWLERLLPDQENALTLAGRALASRRPAVLATVCTAEAGANGDAGEHLLLMEDGTVIGSQALHPLADRAWAERQSQCVREQIGADWTEVFCDYLAPPLPLVIFGGGADALPLTQIAHLLGWHVTVVDHRPAFVRPERFPQSDAVLLAPRETLSPGLSLNEQTAAVVMTHNYLQDRALLAALLPSPVCYLGVLGPRKRTQRLLRELREDGLAITEAMRSRLHGPIGLDIGARTPEQIALAIVAEIQAVTSGRAGGFLCAGSE